MSVKKMWSHFFLQMRWEEMLQEDLNERYHTVSSPRRTQTQTLCTSWPWPAPGTHSRELRSFQCVPSGPSYLLDALPSPSDCGRSFRVQGKDIPFVFCLCVSLVEQAGWCTPRTLEHQLKFKVTLRQPRKQKLFN